MKTTQLEYEVLEAILTSEFQEDENPINAPIWYLDENDVDMKPGQLAGAISSCVKKGYVGQHIVPVRKNKNDSTIWITSEGMIAYDEYNNSIERISGYELSETIGMVSEMLNQIERYSHVEHVVKQFDWLKRPIEQLGEAFAKLDVEMERRVDEELETRD